MPKIPIVKAKILLSFLSKYGCDKISIRGSHHKIFNPKTNMTSTLTIHGGQDVGKGAFSGTLKQLGIDVEDFLEFMKNN
jgi:predicted RNA binding protein YcfA (HicA-like mRNA interferase family)